MPTRETPAPPDEDGDEGREPPAQGGAAEAAKALARKCALQVAAKIWGLKEQLLPPTPQPPEVVQAAVKVASEPDYHGPVVIHETSDNCGCGGPGDGTHLLRAMLDADLGAALGPNPAPWRSRRTGSRPRARQP